MLRIRRMKSIAYLAWALIFALYVGPSGAAFAAGGLGSAKQRLVVFPFALGEGVSQTELGRQAAEAMAQSLQSLGAYEVVQFTKRHPSLQRAVLVERTLQEKDLADAFGEANRETALKIGREMGADLILIADIDSYKYDPATNACEMLVNAELADVRTGKAAKNATVTGRTPENSKAASEDEAASLAAGNAVTKMIEGLGIKAQASEALRDSAATPGKKSHKSKLLWAALALGLGFAFGGGSSGGSTGPSDNGGGDPPPPPPE